MRQNQALAVMLSQRRCFRQWHTDPHAALMSGHVTNHYDIPPPRITGMKDKRLCAVIGPSTLDFRLSTFTFKLAAQPLDRPVRQIQTKNASPHWKPPARSQLPHRVPTALFVLPLFHDSEPIPPPPAMVKAEIPSARVF